MTKSTSAMGTYNKRNQITSAIYNTMIALLDIVLPEETQCFLHWHCLQCSLHET